VSPVIASLLAVGCTLLVGLIVLLLVARTPRPAASDPLAALLSRVAALEAGKVSIAELQGEWAVVCERLEELTETVERKRRRIAATASRLPQGGAAAEPEAENLEDARRRFRAVAG